MVGKTKRGKGTKIMAIVDGHGLPVGVRIESASPHEVKRVEPTLDTVTTTKGPKRLIGDRAYDSDALDARLETERGIELIAPQRRNRRKSHDGRPLRRYRRRWKVERLFAWLQNFRRLVTRWEYHADNFLGSCSSAASSSIYAIYEMASSAVIPVISLIPQAVRQHGPASAWGGRQC